MNCNENTKVNENEISTTGNILASTHSFCTAVETFSTIICKGLSDIYLKPTKENRLFFWETLWLREITHIEDAIYDYKKTLTILGLADKEEIRPIRTCLLQFVDDICKNVDQIYVNRDMLKHDKSADKITQIKCSIHGCCSYIKNVCEENNLITM